MDDSPEQTPSKKEVSRGDIMIPRRRDFMGDLADWFVESPENQKQFDAMMEEIFEEVAQNRKASGEVPPPSDKESKVVDKKSARKKPDSTRKSLSKKRTK